MYHIMLDLETLGTGTNAAIISIGACKFNKTDIIDTFYKPINFNDAVQNGSVSGDTIEWWLNQSEAARTALSKNIKYNLPDALAIFNNYARGCIAIWGNGSTFDNVILRSAYKAVGIEPAWSHRIDLCFRTMCSLAQDMHRVQHGVKHDALDDAVSQAIHLQKIFKKLGV